MLLLLLAPFYLIIVLSSYRSLLSLLILPFTVHYRSLYVLPYYSLVLFASFTDRRSSLSFVYLSLVLMFIAEFIKLVR